MYWTPKVESRGRLAAALKARAATVPLTRLKLSDLDALIAHAELMIFGGLIVFFIIVEPHGLARLWSTAKEKLRLWPFPH